MVEILSRPWPWYVAGPLIGLVVPLLLLFGNKPFGISSNLRHVCAAVVPRGLSGGRSRPAGRDALLRYVLRPPVARERVEQRPDGLLRISLAPPARGG